MQIHYPICQNFDFPQPVSWYRDYSCLQYNMFFCVVWLFVLIIVQSQLLALLNMGKTDRLLITCSNISKKSLESSLRFQLIFSIDTGELNLVVLLLLGFVFLQYSNNTIIFEQRIPWHSTDYTRKVYFTCHLTCKKNCWIMSYMALEEALQRLKNNPDEKEPVLQSILQCSHQHIIF